MVNKKDVHPPDVEALFAGANQGRWKWRTLKENTLINGVIHTKGTQYKVYGSPERGWIAFAGYADNQRLVVFKNKKVLDVVDP